MNKEIMEEIAEKVNSINTLKLELEALIEDVENEDLEDCLREYVEAIGEAEDPVLDTFRDYESDFKSKSLEWIY